MITPGRDGRVYLTPDVYDSGRLARERLALSSTPAGYFEVPEDRLVEPNERRRVQPHGGLPGGGTEVAVAHAIDASDLSWVPMAP